MRFGSGWPNKAHRQELALRPPWLRSKNAAGTHRLISQTYNRNIHLVFAPQPGSGHNDQQGKDESGEWERRVGRWTNLNEISRDVSRLRGRTRSQQQYITLPFPATLGRDGERVLMDTQVGIVGGGPAGLVLSHLLHLQGIEPATVQARSRERLETEVRAGVLEQGTVDLLTEIGAGDRMAREGAVHHGIELRFNRQGHRIPLSDLTGGREIMLYGQHEVVKDLIQARLDAGGNILFEAEAVGLHGLESQRPGIRYQQDDEDLELRCEFVAGCDGYYGVCR